MSEPRPLPPVDAAHERHDAVLIAQQAAGDPLDPAQAREAAQLVASCLACAELAADLRAVSKAVAWEPLPPRRREFGIDRVRAEALRGSAWSRLLRRFALPQGRALRPIAAGVMSLGLVLVIAGNAWPSGDPAAPALGPSQPAARSQASPAPAADAVAGSSVPAALPPSELTIEAPAAVQDTTDDQASLSDVAAPEAGRDEATEERFTTEAKASAAPPLAREASRVERMDAEASVTTDTAAGAVSALQGEGPGRAGPSDATGPDHGEAAPLEAAPLESAAVDAQAVPLPDGDTGEPGPAANQELKASTAEVADDASLDLETIVVWLGAGLALVGALLLGLAWLSRRAADPLLR